MSGSRNRHGRLMCVRNLRKELPMKKLPLMMFAATFILLTVAQGSDAAPARGGRIIFAARQDIDTLDPHLARPVSIRKVLNQFLDTLVVLGPDGKLYPGLAESWS